MSRASEPARLTGRGALAAGGALLLATRLRAAEAARVLVVGRDIAEIVFALGAGGRVIATDDTLLAPHIARLCVGPAHRRVAPCRRNLHP
jgi:ABC-type hemin transport system substrate-binding protein